MCYPVKCQKCGKTTWAGCGAHAQMVMARVPPDQRCCCGQGSQKMPVATTHEREQAVRSMSAIRHISTKPEMLIEAQKAAQEGKIIVVDFWSTGCAPCAMMAPKFEALSKKYPQAVFLKVNGDECEQCCADAGIAAFPSFQIWKNCTCVDEVVGVNEPGLRVAIERNL